MAEAVANGLKARGYRVWWDAELVGSDDYYEVILQALQDAKAAIVIWTKTSVKSRFVRDEASFALNLEKLVATKEPLLNPRDIPFGFQGQHTDDVTSLDHILRAIGKLGVKPVAASVSVDWEKPTAGIDDIVAFLGTNPTVSQRQAAIARLKQVVVGPESTKGGSGVVRTLTMSNWQAFLSGLTFRAPRFQLSTAGTWTSIGASIAYVIIFVVSTYYLHEIIDPNTRDNYVLILFSGGVWGLLALIGWQRVVAFATQRNFLAARIMLFSFTSLAALATASIAVFSTVTAGLVVFGSEGHLYMAMAVLGISFLAFLLLGLTRLRAMR
ncbi:MAG: toll/interleukin-1 receptor domain-containing protein [Hyphomicrobiaceae bacterium]|nr:toll/interleukin-1 receptor domain-containing protein [Hyphomicrobiaceae bacterium]